MYRFFKKTLELAHYPMKLASSLVFRQTAPANLDKDFSSSEILSLIYDGQPNLINYQQIPKETLRDAVGCLIDLYNLDSKMYTKVISDLVSKLGIEEDLRPCQYPLFNWYGHSKYYYYLSQNKFQPVEPGIEIGAISDELEFVYHIIKVFLQHNFPVFKQDISPAIIFNAFFNMIYRNTIETAIKSFESNFWELAKENDKAVCIDESASKALKYLSDLLKFESKKENQYTVSELRNAVENISNAISAIYYSLNIPSEILILNNLEILNACITFLIKDKPVDTQNQVFHPERFNHDFKDFIRFILIFLIRNNDQKLENVFKESLTLDNIRVFPGIQPYLVGFEKVNFFDFNYQNFEYYFIVQMVGSLVGFADATIPHRFQEPCCCSYKECFVENFRNCFNMLASSEFKDLIFCEETFEFCKSFLEDPNSGRFNEISILETFNIGEIHEMWLYEMIKFIAETE